MENQTPTNAGDGKQETGRISLPVLTLNEEQAYFFNEYLDDRNIGDTLIMLRNIQGMAGEAMLESLYQDPETFTHFMYFIDTMEEVWLLRVAENMDRELLLSARQGLIPDHYLGDHQDNADDDDMAIPEPVA